MRQEMNYNKKHERCKEGERIEEVIHSIKIDYPITVDQLPNIRNQFMIGEKLEICISVSPCKVVRKYASILKKYEHYCLCMMQGDYLKCFRWLDMITVYSVKCFS